MDTIQLGDLTVGRLGFGAMRVCGPRVWGPPADRAGALAVLKMAYQLGHNLFDTADSYGPYVSEELIAEALHPRAIASSSEPKSGGSFVRLPAFSGQRSAVSGRAHTRRRPGRSQGTLATSVVGSPAER